MIDAQLIDRVNNIGGRYGDRESLYAQFTFLVPNVVKGGNTSDTIRFKMGDRVGLDFLKIYCLSEKYTLSLYGSKNLSGISMLFSKVDIDKFAAFDDYEQNGSLTVVNEDNPPEPYLYGTIKNNDSSNDTGIISIRFLISSI